MIAANILGGLCNQMFVIAAAFGHAKKINTNWAITKKSWNLFEPYQPYFKYQFNITELNLKPFREKWFHYNPIIGNNIELTNSYFQSFKYFEHCQNEVKKLFEPTDELKNQLPDVKKDTCSIHIRRGDYLKFADYHYNLKLDYYEKAMDLIKNKKFIIFSDDIKWCKKQSLFQNCEFYEGGDGSRSCDDLKDFFTMSFCENQIIANSTFSLWASYLNDNFNKIVIAPKNWFAEKNYNKNTKDLYTSEMIVI